MQIIGYLGEKWNQLKDLIDRKIRKEWDEPSNIFTKWLKNRIKIFQGNQGAKKNIYNYESLMPRDDVDQEEHYIAALNWAIHKEGITNVALMGAYGSGKSSILQSYKKKYLKNSNKYIDISLAKFCSNIIDLRNGQNEESLIHTNQDNANDEKTIKEMIEEELEKIKLSIDKEEMLEKSILQQIFYSVKPNKIPLSRYKRIKKVGWILTALVMGFMCLGMIVFQNPYWKRIEQLILVETPIQILKYEISIQVIRALRITFIIGGFIILIKWVHYIRQSFRVNQFEIKGTQVERKEREDDESIFDKRLEEILYLFDMMKYKVVFIEDLDRFDSIHIFTKLRELNMLINSTRQRKKKVIFVYALRDELFKDYKERTKFFDFIIPVIPHINSSNSGEVLIKKINENNTTSEISQQFAKDITIFIEDTRTLNNICNEYKIYKKNLVPSEKDKEIMDNDKLFAMIVYKNIYPADFAQIQYGKGILHNVFHENKNKLKERMALEIQKKIESIQDQLKDLDKDALVSEEELNDAYREALIRRLGGDEADIYYDGSWRMAKELRKISFEEICDKSIHRTYSGICSREDIESVFRGKEEFKQRKESILKRKELWDEIYKLRIQVQSIQKKQIKELWSKEYENIILGKQGKDNKLLSFMLRKGYIDETYYSYVSYFYVGSITHEDRAFILSVKTQDELPRDHDLTNTQEIIYSLEKEDFHTPYVFNYRLLDGMFILKNSKIMQEHSEVKDIQIMQENFNDKWDALINLIINGTAKSMDFIDGYMQLGEHPEEFIQELCKKWEKIWYTIENTQEWVKEKKDSYLYKIIEYASKTDIINVGKHGNLGEYIAKMSNFLQDLNSGKYIPRREEQQVINTKVIEVIRYFNIKFGNLKYDHQSKEIFEYIYNNNCYIINNNMLEEILVAYGKEEVDLKNESYTAILNTKLDKLKDYIQENIEDYMTNILLVKQSICESNEDSVIVLLNDEKVSAKSKAQIINKIQQPISNLSSVVKDLWLQLMQGYKVEMKWCNVLEYYKEKKVDSALIKNLSIRKNYEQLALDQVDERKQTPEQEVKQILEALILCEGINEEVFAALFRSFNVVKISLSITELIDKGVIGIRINTLLPYIELNDENYIALGGWGDENNFKRYNELLIYNIDVFRNEIEEGSIDKYNLSREDVNYLISSEKVNVKDKVLIVSKTFLDNWSKDKVFLTKVYKLFLLVDRYELEPELLGLLLKQSIDSDLKTRLLTQQIPYLKGKMDLLNDYLGRLSSGDNQIVIGQQGQTTIANTKENRALVNALKNMKYIGKHSFEGERIRIHFLKNIAS